MNKKMAGKMYFCSEKRHFSGREGLVNHDSCVIEVYENAKLLAAASLRRDDAAVFFLNKLNAQLTLDACCVI